MLRHKSRVGESRHDHERQQELRLIELSNPSLHGPPLHVVVPVGSTAEAMGRGGPPGGSGNGCAAAGRGARALGEGGRLC